MKTLSIVMLTGIGVFALRFCYPLLSHLLQAAGRVLPLSPLVVVIANGLLTAVLVTLCCFLAVALTAVVTACIRLPQRLKKETL